nr:hypothetical protein [Holzapfeliella floricola]
MAEFELLGCDDAMVRANICHDFWGIVFKPQKKTKSKEIVSKKYC